MEDSTEIFHDPLQSKLVSLQKYIGILTCPKKYQQHVSTKVNWGYLVVGKRVHLRKLGVWGTCSVQKPAPTALCTGLKSSIFVVEIGTGMCFVHFDLESCFAPQRRALFPYLNFQKWSVHVALCAFWLGNMLRTTTACTFSTSALPKVVRRWCVLCILTWKRASRQNCMHFFNISTSKSGPNMRSFYLFYFKICFALRACTFSTSQFPKVVRTWNVFSLFTSKCASRQNGVHFFNISTSKSGPNVKCF